MIGGNFSLFLARLRRKHHVPLVQWARRRHNAAKAEPYQDPLPPINSVNDDVLTVRDNSFSYFRLFVFVPILLLMWSVCIENMANFGPSQSEVERANKALEDMDNGITPDKSRYLALVSRGVVKSEKYSYQAHLLARKMFAGEDVDATLADDEKRLQYYRELVDSDGKSSLMKYVSAIQQFGTEHQKKRLKKSFITNSIFFLFVAGCTLLFVRAPRPAALHFDRKRGIVYTWSRGKVLACKYDNLGYQWIDKLGGNVCLYSEKGGWFNSVPVRMYALDATSMVHANTQQGNQKFFIAQIVAFMAEGKEAVIKSEHFHRVERSTYFFEDKKPANFDQRLEALLENEHELPTIYSTVKL